MSEKRNFLKASSHYLTSQVAVLGISLISFPIVVRLLSIEDYGILSLCNTILLFAVALSKLGFQHSIIRFYPKYKKQDRLPCFFRSYAIAGLVLGFLFFWVSGFITSISVPDNLSGIVWLVAGVAFVQTLYSYLSNFLRSQEKTTLFSSLSVVSRLLSSFGGICLILLLGNGIFGLFQAQLIGQTVLVVFLVVIFRRYFLGGTDFFSVSLITESVRFGLPLVAFEMSSIALAFSDRFLIGHFNGMEELGIYAVGYTLCMYIGDLLRQPINMAVGPMYTRIYENDGAEKASEFLADLGRIVALIALPIFFGCTAVRVELITFFASDKYLSAAAIIPWVLGGLLFYASQPVISAGLFLKKKTMSVALISFVCVSINICMNYVLLPRYGVIAAAWSTAVSYVLAVVLIYVTSRRQLHVDWPLASILKYFIASVLMFFSVTILVDTSSLFMKIVVGLISYPVYALILDGQLRHQIVLSIMRKRDDK